MSELDGIIIDEVSDLFTRYPLTAPNAPDLKRVEVRGETLKLLRKMADSGASLSMNWEARSPWQGPPPNESLYMMGIPVVCRKDLRDGVVVMVSADGRSEMILIKGFDHGGNGKTKLEALDGYLEPSVDTSQKESLDND